MDASRLVLLRNRVFTVILCILIASATSHYIDSEHPIMLAHRGSRYICAENTLLAYDTALAFGADVLELDVYLTVDGFLVVHHDPVVNRTTNGFGAINKMSFDEVRALDAGYNLTPDKGVTYPYRGKGLRIPTLEEVLNTFPSANINIELKLDDRATADALAALLRSHSTPQRPIEERVLVGSRWCDALAHLRSVYPQLRTSACETEGYLFAVTTLLRVPFLWPYLTSSPQPDAFQLPYRSGGIHLGSKRYIDAAHSLGKKIHFWVVNNATVMRELLERGADGIVTDRPDLAAPVFAELRGLPSPPPPPQLHDARSAIPGAAAGRYYLPAVCEEEEHTCVSLSCRLIQVLSDQPHMLLVMLVAFVVTLRKCVLAGRRVWHVSRKRHVGPLATARASAAATMQQMRKKTS